jgi:hypothetical protein
MVHKIVVSIWAFISSDRGLAITAIVVGVVGIWRAESLFKKLYKRGRIY